MAKIILFGDSILGGYTNGQMTSKITNLIKQAFPTDKIVNASMAGATTDRALGNVNRRVMREHPDVVVLNFGVNDAGLKLAMSAGRYNNNLNILVEKIGAKRVIIVSPSLTNWRVASDQSWPRILQFELVTEHVAKHYQTPYLNLAELMQQQENVLELLQPDGIHLTDKGINLFIKNLVPLIKQKLETTKE